MSEITSFQVEKYRSQRKKEGAKVATINREVACLRNAFNQAIKWKKAKDNPVRDVKFYKELQDRMWVLTKEQERKLLAHLAKDSRRKHVYDITMVGLYSGARLSEILKLRVGDVRGNLSHFHVSESKSGYPRDVPIAKNLVAIFRDAIKGKAQEAYVFTWKGSSDRIGFIKTAFVKAVKQVGLERQRPDDTMERFRFHDTRHTFISRMVMSGADLVSIAEIVGHVDLKMRKRYAHPSPAHKRDAINRLVTTPHQISHQGVDEKADRGLTLVTISA